jgi:phosphatidylglycerophosphatase C
VVAGAVGGTGCCGGRSCARAIETAESETPTRIAILPEATSVRIDLFILYVAWVIGGGCASLIEASPSVESVMLRGVQLQSAADVWARIEGAVRDRPGGLIATDGDGTLWSGDVGEDLFLAFLDCGRVEPAALEALQRDARDHALSDAGTGSDVARRIYDAYIEGAYPEERVCELMTWCFAGWTAAEVQAFARDVVARSGLARRQHDEVFAVIARARAAGVQTVLVSASPVAVVIEAGARTGFDEAHIVAAEPLYQEGVMMAGVDRPIPYGPGKVTRLRRRVGPDRMLYAAFGDNLFDVPLLESAAIAVAVRPKPRLRARAAQVPGIVELARLGDL